MFSELPEDESDSSGSDQFRFPEPFADFTLFLFGQAALQ